MSYYAPTSQGLLEPLQPWLQDPQVSELIINQPGEIFVEKNQLIRSVLSRDFYLKTVVRIVERIEQ